VSVVLNAVAFCPAWRERQHRIQPIERLNGSLLVGGKDDGVLRRIQVQPNDVGGLCLELRVVRAHVPFEPVRLDARAAPDPGDEHVTDPEHLAQLARTPVRAAVRRRLPRLRQHARFQRGRSHPWRLAPVLRAEARHTLGLEPLLPSADVVRVTAHRSRDGRV
jgi:hypothetical protein